jgi:small-conductance mechanosensitive channel
VTGNEYFYWVVTLSALIGVCIGFASQNILFGLAAFLSIFILAPVK